jgi:opacity protein-like surface antigen
MRSMLAVAVFAAVLFSAAAAQAEKRVFIIPGGSDGYGVDHCLASGAACGAAAANAYCHSHEFGQALSYRKVDRDDITGAIPTSGPGSCRGASCDEFVAITCSR